VRSDMVWVLQLLHPCRPTMFQALWLMPDANRSSAAASLCEAWHFILKHELELHLPMPQDVNLAAEQGRASRQVSD
jgi:hypothetical protein